MRGIILALIAAFLSAHIARAADISGTVGRIQDEDTFELCINGDCSTRIRLCGIDAPEKDDAGFEAAASAFQIFVGDKPVRCIVVGDGSVCDGRSRRVNRGRIVAQCFTEDGDIAEFMVRNRYACDWVKFSGGHYSKDGRGLACSAGNRRR